MSAGITELEWKERCAKRFVDVGGFAWPTARGLADAFYEALEGTDLNDESPEEAADEEMSNWSNDEGNTPD